jgi:DNA-directed RNA polymerase subunit RPC12/RpoP
MPALKERKSSSSNQCDICFEQFHILGKWPMLACPNSHYFCDQCIKGMLERNNNEPVPCPMCRALIKKSLVKPNVQLFRALNEGNTVKFALKS